MEQGDLNAAHLFVEVVRRGSFTKAAKALELPKSTLSRKVSELEERLGARLLQRTTRQLSLTDVGAVYYERVLRVVTDLSEAEAAVSDAQGRPRGVIRVTAPTDIGITILAWALPEFSRRYPEVEIVLDLSGRTVDLVKEGVDVAIRAGELTDSTLIAKPLVSDVFQFFASPEYLNRRGRPKNLADLVEHDCLVFGNSPEKRWIFGSKEGSETVDVRGRVAIKDFSYLRMAAVAGGGIVALPTLLVTPDVQWGRLEVVLPDYSSPSGTLHIAYPSREFFPPKTRVFVDFMVETFAQARTLCTKKCVEACRGGAEEPAPPESGTAPLVGACH